MWPPGRQWDLGPLRGRFRARTGSNPDEPGGGRPARLRPVRRQASSGAAGRWARSGRSFFSDFSGTTKR